jgi:integrase
MNFTEARVRDAQPGNYRDEDVACLYLRVSPTARTFRYSAWSKADKQPMNVSLGKWPTVTVETARKEAKRLDLRNADGHSLRKSSMVVAQPVIIEAMTIGRAVEHYEGHLQEKAARTSWLQDAINGGFSDWNERALASVTKLELRERIATIRRERGDGAGDTSFKAIRALYRFAITSLDVDTPNPAIGMKLPTREARQRFLNADERKRFIAAMDTPGELPHIPVFFRLLLLTGCRRANLETAEWSEFDLEARKWTIPASKFKTGETKAFPLRDDAVALLKKWKARKEAHARWVFESPVLPDAHLGDTWQQFRRLAKVAGFEVEGDSKVTPHDIRRSFARILIDNGVHIAEVSKALGHGSIATTMKAYAPSDTKRVASELDRVSGW